MSVSDTVDVVVVSAVYLSVIAQAYEGVFEVFVLHLVLKVRVDVALVNELVLFGDFLHDREDKLLCVRRCCHSCSKATWHARVWATTEHRS